MVAVVLHRFDQGVVTRSTCKPECAVAQAAAYFENPLGACRCGQHPKQRCVGGGIDVAAVLVSMLY